MPCAENPSFVGITAMSQDTKLVTYYQAASQHWAHAEQIRWTLLYNYLMGSSILLIAWAAVFAGAVTSGRLAVLFLLSFVGFLLSVAWAGLGWRGSTFVSVYAKLGNDLEDLIDRAGGQSGVPGPFGVAGNHRRDLKAPVAWAESRVIVIGVPLVFAVAYLALLGVSILCK
jgi:hypothetical protein